MNLDAELRAAHDRVGETIERSFDNARRWLIDAVNDARRANGFAPLVILTHGRHCIAPARLRCPECGGRIRVEIEDWEYTTGKPNDALVICENEDWDGDDGHRHRWFDWDGVTIDAARWARANVRIL